MTEEEKKAYDFAADTVKQLITLSSGIIALTITFSKDIVGSSIVVGSMWMFISWILYIISIFFGVLSLLSLTGNLQPRAQSSQNSGSNIYDKNITTKVGIQVAAFIFALIFTVIFGIITIYHVKKENDKNNNIIENSNNKKIE